MLRFSATSAALAGLLLAGAARRAATPSGPSDLELVRLGDAVYAAVRTSPLGLAVNSNSLIVVGDDGVTVVDAQFTREATLETLAAVRRITRKPVRRVINTHWHDDHLAGNQVYRDTFPDVEFVLHANTRADLTTLGVPNRNATRTAAPPLVAEYTRLLGAGLGIDSTPVSERERESLERALQIERQYLAELPGFRETVGGTTVQDSVTLGSGPNAVEVRWFGRGNTRGDLVAWLPASGVLATGDLVVAPVPLAFGSHPSEWIDVLDSLVALRPRVIVPGHGPVMRDLSYVRRVRAMLAAVRDQVAASVARGDSLPAALDAVTLDEQRRAVAGEEKWMNYMFTRFFLRPAVTAAYREAASPRVR